METSPAGGCVLSGGTGATGGGVHLRHGRWEIVRQAACGRTSSTRGRERPAGPAWGCASSTRWRKRPAGGPGGVRLRRGGRKRPAQRPGGVRLNRAGPNAGPGCSAGPGWVGTSDRCGLFERRRGLRARIFRPVWTFRGAGVRVGRDFPTGVGISGGRGRVGRDFRQCALFDRWNRRTTRVQGDHPMSEVVHSFQQPEALSTDLGGGGTTGLCIRITR